jgi:hypothetical protein
VPLALVPQRVAVAAAATARPEGDAAIGAAASSGVAKRAAVLEARRRALPLVGAAAMTPLRLNSARSIFAREGSASGGALLPLGGGGGGGGGLQGFDRSFDVLDEAFDSSDDERSPGFAFDGRGRGVGGGAGEAPFGVFGQAVQHDLLVLPPSPHRLAGGRPNSILGLLGEAGATPVPSLPAQPSDSGDAAQRAAQRSGFARRAVSRECEALDALSPLDAADEGADSVNAERGGEVVEAEGAEEGVAALRSEEEGAAAAAAAAEAAADASPRWQRDTTSVLAPLRRGGMPSAPTAVDVISIGDVCPSDGGDLEGVGAAARSARAPTRRTEVALLGFEDGLLQLWVRDARGGRHAFEAQLDGLITSVRLTRVDAAGHIDAVVCGGSGWAVHFARIVADDGSVLDGLRCFALLPRSAEFECVTCSLVVDLAMRGAAHAPELLLGTTSGALLHYVREDSCASGAYVHAGCTLMSSPILALGVLAGPDATSVPAQRVVLYSLDGVHLLRPPVEETLGAIEAAVVRLEALVARAGA